MKKLRVSFLIMFVFIFLMASMNMVDASDDLYNPMVTTSDLEPEASEATSLDEFTLYESQALLEKQWRNGQDFASQDAFLGRASVPLWSGSKGNRTFFNGYGEVFGATGKATKVIDISQWQGTIDWDKVKQLGDIDGVIVRCGFGSNNIDTQFARNIKELTRLKIPYGIYLYSYATDAAGATTEANFVKSLIKNYNLKLSYPIYYDIERWPNGGYTQNGKWVACPTTLAQYKPIISSFVGSMKASGYANTNVYSYRSYMQNQLNDPSIIKETTWIAEYGPKLNYTNTLNSGLSGWQYSSDGGVNGIIGKVDMNAFYKDPNLSPPTNTQNTVGASSNKAANEPHIYYKATVQSQGGLGEFCEPNTSGTTGQALDLYQLNIRLSNATSNINLIANINNSGKWTTLDNIQNGNNIGTSGKAMQQVSFELSNLTTYRLEYRVHSANLGWQSWVSQGNIAGQTGKNIQAIEFRLVKVVATPLELTYQGHSQFTGWSKMVGDSQTIGATGKRLESLKISVANAPNYILSGKVHIQNIGWVNYASIKPTTLIGTQGKGLRMEAITLDLQNVAGKKIQYRVYIKNVGWETWHDQSQVAGTVGLGMQIEAMQIRLVSSSTAISKPSLLYQAHVQGIGWMSYKNEGQLSGTSGLSKRLEALKIVLTNVNVNATITASVHVQNIGWLSAKGVGNTISFGTVGKGLRIEAIKLTTKNLGNYKLQYRVYVQGIGWTAWVNEENIAGTVGQSKRIEAIEIRVAAR